MDPRAEQAVEGKAQMFSADSPFLSLPTGVPVPASSSGGHQAVFSHGLSLGSGRHLQDPGLALLGSRGARPSEGYL